VIGHFEPLVKCTGPDGHGCDDAALVEAGRKCDGCHRTAVNAERGYLSELLIYSRRRDKTAGGAR
jgi:hypothetical protein